MSILDDSTEDHIASSGFIPGTQFTRTKTVSLLDQIKEREREEKLEKSVRERRVVLVVEEDEDDVDELLEIFGGEEDARFEDDDDDDVEENRKKKRTREKFSTPMERAVHNETILKVDADSWTEDTKHKFQRKRRRRILRNGIGDG